MRGPADARCFLFLRWSVVLAGLIRMSDGVIITFLVYSSQLQSFLVRCGM